MRRRNENRLRKRLLTESRNLIIELVSQDIRHQLHKTCHFAVTSALLLRRRNINFRNSKKKSPRKYLNFKRTGQEKKIRILHTKKISEVSAAFTRMFSFVTTILKITQFQKQTAPFFTWRRRALFRVFLWRWKRIPVNAADIYLVRPLSKMCLLLEFLVAQPPHWQTVISKITSTCGYRNEDNSWVWGGG
jgi:hypothetical protein